MFHSARKKIRGQRRRLKTLLRDINALVPYQDDTHREYEHFHVPCGAWIQSPRTAGHIKTIFCNAWIEKSKQFIESKPKNIPFCKVVAVISYPRFAESQIIIFYNEAYYNGFWNRNDSTQKWIPLNSAESFVKSRGIVTDLSEKGYTEILCDEDGCISKSQLWFYGELDS